VTHDMRYLLLLLKADLCIYIIFRLDARWVFQIDSQIDLPILHGLPMLHGQHNFAQEPRDYSSAPIYTSTAPVGMKAWRMASPVNRPILTIAPSGIGFLPMNEPYTSAERHVKTHQPYLEEMRASYHLPNFQV